MELRQQARLLNDHPGMETPIAVFVERFLDEYTKLVVHQDYRNELNWFMGADTSKATGAGVKNNRRGENRPSGDVSAFPVRRGQSAGSMPISSRSL